jgi:peptidyl-prolyl cis-trans isomerase SurA
MSTIMKRSRKIGNFNLFNRYVFVIALLWAFSICQPAVAALSKVVDRIVAVVNDEIIVLQELNELLAPYEAQMQVSGYPAEKQRQMIFEVRQTILNQLIDQKLIEQVANTSQLTVEEKEIDSSIERIKEGNRLTDEDFREALESQGMTMEIYRKKMRGQILASRLETLEVKRKIVITKDEVKANYEENSSKYAGEVKYHLRNIIMKASTFEEAEKKKAVYDAMQNVITEFNSGKSFESLATSYSESPFAQEGGELGIFRLSDLSENLKQAVEPLSPGKITGILESSQGYQIIYLQEIIEAPGIPLEEASREIEELLYQEQYKNKKKEWIDRLRNRAHIKVIQ